MQASKGFPGVEMDFDNIERWVCFRCVQHVSRTRIRAQIGQLNASDIVALGPENKGAVQPSKVLPADRARARRQDAREYVL